ncbi:MAG: protoporphyrinogen oxidase HemJ [Epsilonproteobacteria bacterium]|nr:MAG: protoporphyrinogen oxidase HemJ [Campylobacterota bacterium]
MAYYNWILAFHVMSFMSWMAMLFYQPRLYVYHREHADKADFVEVVKIQEYKLYKYIGLPAMWATIITGIWMIILIPGLLEGSMWLSIKLIFAALMIVYSFSLEWFRLKLADDPHYKSGKFFRFYNEVPTLLMIVIVIMVVIKPF